MALRLELFPLVVWVAAVDFFSADIPRNGDSSHKQPMATVAPVKILNLVLINIKLAHRLSSGRAQVKALSEENFRFHSPDCERQSKGCLT